MINSHPWGMFEVSELFEVSLAKGDIKQDNYSKGSIPLISSGQLNNGVVDYISEEADGVSEMFSGNKITVDMFCNAFYQEHDFFAVSHGRVNIMTPKFSMSKLVALFIISLIKKEAYKYSYGRAVYSGVLKKMILKLPICKSGKPNWDYIEEFMQSLNIEPTITQNKIEHSLKIKNPKEWVPFELGKLFNIVKGRRLTKEDMIPGSTNFLGAISVNNGVREKIEVDEIMKPNCITVNYNGSVGEAFYQIEPFWASDDVNILYPLDWDMNQYNGMFLATLIKLERPKYSYGRKWTLTNMKKSTIKLPVNKEGNPDWNYMEEFIKTLPNGDLIKG